MQMAFELLGGEFRRLFGDALRATADWRRLRKRVLPLAALGGVTTGSLVARKYTDPPETNFVGSSVTFRCVPRGEAESRGGFPSPKVVETTLRQVGADVPALRRASERLRGFIERDLLQAERALRSEGGSEVQRKALYAQLLESWKAVGFDSEPVDFVKPPAADWGINLLSRTDESYGRDVGCHVPLSVLAPEAPKAKEIQVLPLPALTEAADALESCGLVVLKGAMRDTQVASIRDQLGLQGSVLDKARSSGTGPLRDVDLSKLQGEDESLEPVVSTAGRKHVYLRKSPLEQVVREAQTAAMPLVWEALQRQAAEVGTRLPELKPYISEVQLMLSTPCATDQFWHVDNANSGLTLVVPLTPMPEDVGATRFLSGSHHLLETSGFFSRTRRFLRAALSSNGVPAVTLEAGDALLYDARSLHTTATNRRYDRTVVVLVFRYDYERPPGLTTWGTQQLSWLGNILAGAQRFYGSLPGPTKLGDAAQAK